MTPRSLALLAPLLTSCSSTPPHPGRAPAEAPPSARVPIALDPSLGASQVKITASDGAAEDRFAYALASAGDVDADGFAEIVVGATGDDDRGAEAGAAYVYPGASTGVSTADEVKLTASDGGANHLFGASVAGGLDVDGDGYGDVLVGAHGAVSYTGAVYVFYGGAAGLPSGREEKLVASDGAANDSFGQKLAAAGDLDGDGYDDFVVGAHGDDDNGSTAGAAYVHFGSASGVATGRTTKLVAADGTADDYYGRQVAGAGDVDGDGYDDVVVGANGDDDLGSSAGSAYVYYGGAGGLSGRWEKVTAPDGAADARFGVALSAAGDVDGDGYADFLVGAYGDATYGAWSGAAYLCFGGAGGVDTGRTQKLTASDGAAGDYFGYAVGAAGDLDADGYDEVVVGASSEADLGSNAGAVYVYGGGPGGASGEVKIHASDGRASHRFGVTVAGAGDLNGDGSDDLAVGATGDTDNGSEAGAVYVIHGLCPDADGDGACTGVDCADDDATVFPGATDVPGDGVDQDCDGADAVADTGDSGGGDTGDSGADTDVVDDTDPVDSGADTDPVDSGAPPAGGGGGGGEAEEGWGCAVGAVSPAGALGLLGLLAVLRRRRAGGRRGRTNAL